MNIPVSGKFIQYCLYVFLIQIKLYPLSKGLDYSLLEAMNRINNQEGVSEYTVRSCLQDVSSKPAAEPVVVTFWVNPIPRCCHAAREKNPYLDAVNLPSSQLSPI